jgi:hypothetical protein
MDVQLSLSGEDSPADVAREVVGFSVRHPVVFQLHSSGESLVANMALKIFVVKHSVVPVEVSDCSKDLVADAATMIPHSWRMHRFMSVEVGHRSKSFRAVQDITYE